MPHQHHAGHQHHHEKRQGGETIVQYVYKTAAKTFDGPVGGYRTVNPPENTPQAQSQQKSDQQQQQQAAAYSRAAAQAAASEAAASAQAVQDSLATSTVLDSVSSQDATSTADASSAAPTTSPKSKASKSAVAATPTTPDVLAQGQSSSYISATASSSASAVPDTSSGGMTGGAKAGLAIGILLIIGLLGALAFFFIRRRKERDNGETGYEKTDDEKSAYAAGLARAQSTASTRTAATAPRLSLRPVTQFLPDLAARGKAANAVAGAGLHDSSLASVAAMAKHQHDNEKSNPFGDHAAAAQPSRTSATLPIQNNAAENPFGNHAAAPPPIDGFAQPAAPATDFPAPLRMKTPTPEGAAAAAAGAGALAGAGAGALLAAKSAERRDAPQDLNQTPGRPVSPSPSSAASEFSQTPASPGAMANGAQPSNVYRIQLDFKPSMEDELGLRAGDLVRLLHEYDDGWALCIRLDRSQQGVAPRTCLSARPVKPRPRNGPPRGPGPGPRGPPPPGMRGPGQQPRPQSPAGMRGPGQQRPQSPAGGRGSPGPYGPNGRVPRPLGPGQNGGAPRSMSPGPYGGGPQRLPQGPPPGGKRRSNSASDLRRMSPPGQGPSRMNPNLQRVPMQQQAVDGMGSRSPPASMSGRMTPTRKPVPGQAM